MYEKIFKYISECLEHQMNKVPKKPSAGSLQPLEVPNRCCDVVTTDFHTTLQETTSGLDSIPIIVGKLLKRAILEPVKKHLNLRVFHSFFITDCSAFMVSQLQ